MTEGNGGGSGSGGPCGACKFLRRKCVAGCVFAPYFDPAEQGTAHFAAVHKVFGASNASKLLMKIPANKRLDAVVTLCYEASARVRDPVYGCVAHIFALQQQVVNLQSELAYVQAYLSTLERFPPPPQLPPPPPPPPLPTYQLRSHSPPEAASSSYVPLSSISTKNNLSSLSQFQYIFQQQQEEQEVSTELMDFNTLLGREEGMGEEGDLHALAQEFISKYLTGVKFMPLSSN